MDGFTAEDSSGLAGFTGTEADGASRASCGNANVGGNVGATEEDVNAYSEGANFNVGISTVLVGYIFNSAIAVNGMVFAGRIREFE